MCECAVCRTRSHNRNGKKPTCNCITIHKCDLSRIICTVKTLRVFYNTPMELIWSKQTKNVIVIFASVVLIRRISARGLFIMHGCDYYPFAMCNNKRVHFLWLECKLTTLSCTHKYTHKCIVNYLSANSFLFAVCIPVSCHVMACRTRKDIPVLLSSCNAFDIIQLR